MYNFKSFGKERKVKQKLKLAWKTMFIRKWIKIVCANTLEVSAFHTVTFGGAMLLFAYSTQAKIFIHVLNLQCTIVSTDIQKCL